MELIVQSLFVIDQEEMPLPVFVEQLNKFSQEQKGKYHFLPADTVFCTQSKNNHIGTTYRVVLRFNLREKPNKKSYRFSLKNEKIIVRDSDS